MGGVAVPAGGAEHRRELQRVQHRAALAFPRHPGPGHRHGGVGRNELVDDRVLEQPGDGGQAAAEGGRGIATGFEVPQGQLQVRPADGHRWQLVVGAPLQKHSRSRRYALRLAHGNDPRARVRCSHCTFW